MKNKVIIKRNDDIIYDGSILDIPIKNEHIIQKSIEIFSDDDPCIIHKSFVIKKITDTLYQLLIKNEKKIQCINHLNVLHFLNIDVLEECEIYLKG